MSYITSLSQKNWFVFFSFWVLAAVFLACVSPTLSVAWQDNTLNADINIYHILGRSWTQGYIPYRDLWDVKGPGQFLQYALASLISPGNLAGMLVVHSATVACILFFVFKLASLYLRRMPAVFVAVCMMLCGCEFSGHPSETVLAFQMIVCYLFFKKASSLSALFVCGACMGVSLVIKFNLAAFFGPLAVGMLFFCCPNLLAIWRRLGALLGGVAAVVAPFILYFFWHGALYDVWDGYVLTAVSYATTSSRPSALAAADLGLIAKFMPNYGMLASFVPAGILAGCAIFLLLGGIVICSVRSRLYGLSAMMVACLWGSLILSVYAVFGGYYAFAHYYYTFYPFIALTLVCTVKWLVARNIVWPKRAVGWLVLAGMLVVSLLTCMTYLYNNEAKKRRETLTTVRAVRETFNPAGQPPPSVLVLPNALVGFYRLSPLPPPHRNFIMQLTSQGERAWAEMCCELMENKRIDLVVCPLDLSGQPAFLSGEMVTRLLANYTLQAAYPVSPPYIYRRLGVFKKNGAD